MKSTFAIAIFLVISSHLALYGAPGERTNNPPSEAHIKTCLVSFIDDVEVPALETGLLVAVKAQEGDAVKMNTLLAQLDDRKSRMAKMAAELERDAALARASDDIEVEFAKASLDVADAELSQNLAINASAPGTVTETELSRLRLTRHRSELQIDRSRLDMKVANMTADIKNTEVLMAEEDKLRRQIMAPLDGIVFSINHEEGEWVNAGETVMRIVRMEKLRVEGFLDAKEFNAHEIADKPAIVQFQLARGQKAKLNGKVVFVTPMASAGGKFRVRIEVTNSKLNGHWLLRPGTTAETTIYLRN